MSNAKLTPDYLFEVSWEVCNKIGGIHTVVSTKAQTAIRKFNERYILIGPDLQHEGVNPEFEEDPNLLKTWRQGLYAEGIRIRVGHWKIKGEPTAILVDFTSLIPRKDEILKKLWEAYHVDSISGQWDYIEPVLFGYAAGAVIASYVENFCTATDKIAAHFHEWMTAAGGLYLRRHAPYVATLFTTHATVMGRCIAGNHLPLYTDLTKFNADELARQFNVVAKHSIEKAAAAYHDAFVTVSDITANECKFLLGREPDCITPNGFENDFVWTGEEYDAKRAEARKTMISVAEACLGEKFAEEPLIVGQRTLRIPQQGHRRIHRIAQETGRIAPAQTSGAGLYHRARRQPRSARGPAGASGRPVETHRRRAVQIHDPLPRIPEQRPDR